MSRPTAALSWIITWKGRDGISGLTIVSEERLYMTIRDLRQAHARDIHWERA